MTRMACEVNYQGASQKKSGDIFSLERERIIDAMKYREY
jgi:hypothetical protein